MCGTFTLQLREENFKVCRTAVRLVWHYSPLQSNMKRDLVPPFQFT